jgi:DNA polymerase III subunit delta'
MWSITGHNQALATLERSLAEDRLAHAYLITGPARIGKARLAIELAKAMNCLGDARPCGACVSCRRIEAGLHPDVELIGLGGLCDESDHDHSRDGSKDIKICQIRRLERMVALKPFEGRRRAIIINPADALNVYAADALLKTLEEPPDEVTIVLVAVDSASLPETVISRARQISLSPVSVDRVRQTLVERSVEPQRAELLARLSEGRIGWALAHAADDSLLEQRDERLERIESLLDERAADRMRSAADLAALFARDREDVYAHLDLWKAYCRDLLLVSEGCDDLVANSDRLPRLRSLARLLTAAGIVKALTSLRACRRQLEDNANARLALEVLLLRLPRPAQYEEAGP